jgi:hypothetical protein
MHMLDPTSQGCEPEAPPEDTQPSSLEVYEPKPVPSVGVEQASYPETSSDDYSKDKGELGTAFSREGLANSMSSKDENEGSEAPQDSTSGGDGRPPNSISHVVANGPDSQAHRNESGKQKDARNTVCVWSTHCTFRYSHAL